MQAPQFLFAPGDFCKFWADRHGVYVYGKIVSIDNAQRTCCVTTSHEINVNIYPALEWRHIVRPTLRETARMRREEWPHIAPIVGRDNMDPPCVVVARNVRPRADAGDDA